LVQRVVEAKLEYNLMSICTGLFLDIGGFVYRWIMNIPKNCAAFFIHPWRIYFVHTRRYSKDFDRKFALGIFREYY
jgi:hypothetical protein